MALTAGSFTAASVYQTTGSETSSQLALDASMNAGDWTILACSLVASSGTIDTPNGWTALSASTTSTASTSHASAVFARKYVSGDADPVVNHTSGRFAAVVVKVIGADPTTFLDVAASIDTSAAVAATTVVAPTKTPTSASAVMVTVHTARTSVNGDVLTWTPPSGMTEIGDTSSTFTGSNASLVVSVVAVGSGVASGTKTATASGATNGATAVSFVVKNATTATTSVTSTKPAAWNVIARVTDTAASSWNVRNLDSITSTKAAAWSVVGTVTDTLASSWNVRAEVTDSFPSAWTVLSLVGGGAAYGQFSVRYLAYAPNGARLGMLLKPLEASAGLTVNDVPALRLSYAPGSAGAQFLTSACEIAIEWSLSGDVWTEPANGRYVRIKRGDNNLEMTPKVTYDCPGYAWLLGKAKLFPSVRDVDGKRPFSNATAGAMLKTLLDECKARGALAGLSYDFTTTLDSGGVPWANQVNLEPEVGADMLTIVQSLADQGVIDYTMQGRTLRVFNASQYWQSGGIYNAPGYLSRDLSTGSSPVTLRAGRDITDAPDTASLEDVVTDVMVIGDEGVKTTINSPSAVSPWGRWEALVTQSGVKDIPTMTLLGNQTLMEGRKERVEATRALTFQRAAFLPFSHYRPGDFVLAPDDTGAMTGQRVMAITLETNNNGTVAGNVTLNDRFQDAEVKRARKLASILSGAVTTGGTGTTPAPVGVDKTIPANPTGIGTSTLFYQDGEGKTYATVTLSWTNPTLNTDGSALTDFRGSEVWERENKSDGTWHRRTFVEGDDTVLTIGPFDAGSQWVFTVKARDEAGHVSASGAYVPVTMATDTTAPTQPATPVLFPYLGQLIVQLSGKDVNGLPYPADFAQARIYASTSSGFTPGASTLKGAIISRDGGQFLLSGLTYDATYYVKVILVDRSGNESTASAQASSIPTRIANVDVGDGTINGVKIQPGSITAEMALFNAAAIQRADIALLAVDDARIANLAVGKLVTGELAADTRVIAGKDAEDHAEMRSDGFAVVSHDDNGAPIDVVRMGNATSQYFSIPDPDSGPETSLAAIDEDGNGNFQGLTVAGVDNTDTGAVIYGRDFSEWLDDLPAGEVAQAYATGSTTPIDATAEVMLAEVSFQFTQGRHYRVQWNGIHSYSPGGAGTLAIGQIRMISTSDGTTPSGSNGVINASQFIGSQAANGQFVTTPPMDVMGDWGDDGDTIRVGIFARRYYGTNPWNVLTSGGAAYQNPYRLWVEDIGPAPLNSWQTPGSATAKKQYTKTFLSTFTRTFRGDGVARSDTTDAIQGYDTVKGDHRTYIGFTSMTSTLTGVLAADIKKIEVYLYCNYTGLSTGGTAKIGFHGYTTSPATMVTNTTQLSTKFTRPQGRWVSLPLTTPGNWVTGTWRGITLGAAGTTSKAYYMRFNGFSNWRYKPQFRITYLK